MKHKKAKRNKKKKNTNQTKTKQDSIKWGSNQEWKINSETGYIK